MVRLRNGLGAGGGQQSFAPWWGRMLMGWSPDSGGPWVAEPGAEMVTWKVASTGQWQSSRRMVAAVSGQLHHPPDKNTGSSENSVCAQETW